MRKLIAGTILVAGSILASTNAQAGSNRVIYGEYQKITTNIPSNVRLDIAMAPRSWNTNKYRCDHWGGHLVKEQWRGRTIHVCQNVDH